MSTFFSAFSWAGTVTQGINLTLSLSFFHFPAMCTGCAQIFWCFLSCHTNTCSDPHLLTSFLWSFFSPTFPAQTLPSFSWVKTKMWRSFALIGTLIEEEVPLRTATCASPPNSAHCHYPGGSCPVFTPVPSHWQSQENLVNGTNEGTLYSLDTQISYWYFTYVTSASSLAISCGWWTKSSRGVCIFHKYRAMS